MAGVQMFYLLNMLMFYSYVQFSEGISWFWTQTFCFTLQKTRGKKSRLTAQIAKVTKA
jgi:hypothetical protein